MIHDQLSKMPMRLTGPALECGRRGMGNAIRPNLSRIFAKGLFLLTFASWDLA